MEGNGSEGQLEVAETEYQAKSQDHEQERQLGSLKIRGSAGSCVLGALSGENTISHSKASINQREA